MRQGFASWKGQSFFAAGEDSGKLRAGIRWECRYAVLGKSATSPLKFAYLSTMDEFFRLSSFGAFIMMQIERHPYENSGASPRERSHFKSSSSR